jgi:hypothetical protein
MPPPSRIPPSDCPACGRPHLFDRHDPGPRQIKPGDLVICPGCAAVNRFDEDMVLVPVTAPALLNDPTVVDERWRVIAVEGLPIPDDLLPDLPADPEVEAVRVDTDPPVFRSEGGPDEFGLVTTTGDRSIAWLVFSFLAGIHLDVDPGRRFRVDLLSSGEITLAPIPDRVAAELPGDRSWLQVVWQTPAGEWPWDNDDQPPVLAGSDWRPDPGPSVLVSSPPVDPPDRIELPGDV